MKHLALVCALAYLTSCNTPSGDQSAVTDREEAEITTSGEPMLEGSGEWVDLLANQNLDNWHSYGQDEAGTAWKFDETGAVYLDASNKNDSGAVIGGGDLTTNEDYANYEMELEWKISECGNSGIIYNVVDDEQYGASYLTGAEMQILDNSCHPDAKIVTHRAGDLYDMITGEPENVKPAGEWNSVRLVVTDGYVEHWQNGEKIVSYDNTGEEWKAMIADSKFKDWEAFGMSTSGKISLQDHGDPVWFRNVRIRELNSK